MTTLCAVCLCWVMRGMAFCNKSTASETANNLSFTLHEWDPLSGLCCHEWALTLKKIIKLTVVLNKYQNAQVKRYVMLTMQNINKISNKINWILRFCVTVHWIIQYITSVSIIHIFLSQSEPTSIQSPRSLTTKLAHVAATGCKELGVYLSGTGHEYKGQSCLSALKQNVL